MKLLALLLAALGLLYAQDRQGNFDLRFEPKAVLQTGVPIPFEITIKDDLHKPVTQAKVTLQIETVDHERLKVYPASAVNPGVYIAKPVFPVAGEWNVYVEVRRPAVGATDVSARTIQFNVPQTAQ